MVLTAIVLIAKPDWVARTWDKQGLVPHFMKPYPASVAVTRLTGVLMLAFVALIVVLAVVLPVR